MPSYPIYDIATGEIKRVVICSLPMIDLQIQEQESYIKADTPSDATQYVDIIQKKIKDKKPLPYKINKNKITNDGIDSIIISDMPAATRVYLPGIVKADIPEGVFEFKTDKAGTYVLKLSCFPYLDKEIEIEVCQSEKE